jgi:hypothetical protein
MGDVSGTQLSELLDHESQAGNDRGILKSLKSWLSSLVTTQASSDLEEELVDVDDPDEEVGSRCSPKKFCKYFGPAMFISVGYMDPGNCTLGSGFLTHYVTGASDVEGGSTHGYRLLWVLLLSNLMALLLQTLAVRLGIVTGAFSFQKLLPSK